MIQREHAVKIFKGSDVLQNRVKELQEQDVPQYISRRLFQVFNDNLNDDLYGSDGLVICIKQLLSQEIKTVSHVFDNNPMKGVIRLGRLMKRLQEVK
jgi:hypothetical protein